MKPKPVNVIYNPRAGTKRRLVTAGNGLTVEELKSLFRKYQIPATFSRTRHANHAKELAKQAVKKGYKTIIVAGGDGTVGEAANGLVGTKATLGILPMGTFMNIARMLSIPSDLEKAMMLLKIGRVRTIDAGCITKESGERLPEPSYFFESAGIGLDALLQAHMLEWEHGDAGGLMRALKSVFTHYTDLVRLRMDHGTVRTRTGLITVSNGPFAGAGLRLSPESKLNDHRLTVSLYRMPRAEMIAYFYQLLRGEQPPSPHIKTYKTRRLTITTTHERPLHADARLFGTTPASFHIIPNALRVIAGFPDEKQRSLKRRTYLDP